jgi:hypothetical protein
MANRLTGVGVTRELPISRNTTVGDDVVARVAV